ILNKTILKVGKSKFRICEIEFYLYNKKHKDKYVNGHKDQLQYGKWYFHKMGQSESYKGGTFMGLDLALGNKKKKSYCGILLRSMYDIKKKEMITGSCNLVKRILKELTKT